MKSHSAGRRMMNLLFLFLFAFTLAGCNESSTGSSGATSNNSSKAGAEKVFEQTAAAVSVVNETLGSGVQNIYISGISGSKVVYTDFGGTDIYTVLPTMAGDVEIRDNQASTINLPAGLSISAVKFLKNGVQFTINGFTLTFLGKPELFTYVFAGNPMSQGTGISKTFAETAVIFGTSIPSTSQPNDATITGVIQGDGSLKPNSNTDPVPSVPTGLTSSLVLSTAIGVSWSVSTDNEEVKGYKIYRNGSLVQTVSSGTAWVDTGLEASTSYCYQVSAFDKYGNDINNAGESAKSSQLCVTTQSSQKYTEVDQAKSAIESGLVKGNIDEAIIAYPEDKREKKRELFETMGSDGMKIMGEAILRAEIVEQTENMIIYKTRMQLEGGSYGDVRFSFIKVNGAWVVGYM